MGITFSSFLKGGVVYAQRIGDTCRLWIDEAEVGRIYEPLLKFLRVNDCSGNSATHDNTHSASNNVL